MIGDLEHISRAAAGTVADRMQVLHFSNNSVRIPFQTVFEGSGSRSAFHSMLHNSDESPWISKV
jgi:hypothetical protein